MDAIIQSSGSCRLSVQHLPMLSSCYELLQHYLSACCLIDEATQKYHDTVNAINDAYLQEFSPHPSYTNLKNLLIRRAEKELDEVKKSSNEATIWNELSSFLNDAPVTLWRPSEVSSDGWD